MATLTDLPELSTAADVAHLLRTSERTVQRRVAEGVYPCHRVGHLLRFTPGDLDQIVATTQTTPEARS